ncbi:murein biosynthesis integral membrane protein MurJ [bacterium]|nr:murein biosynthesis integral membrane protein MurJ [bacterium]
MLNKKFLKNTVAVGGLTFLSRISGLIRDLFVAKYLGAGKLSDCFLVAFRIPNLFRSIFAEGAFNSAFIPIFSGILYTDGKEKAKNFCQSIFALLFYILLIFTLICEIFMPQVVQIFAPGFSQNLDKFELAVTLSRITFPFLFFIALTSFFGSILNTLGNFKPYASTPIILNLCIVFSLLLFAKFFPNPAYAVSWGVFASGIIQLWWLFWIAKNYGFGIISFRANMTPSVIQFFKKIMPGIMGAGIYHLNIMIGSIFATPTNGAVSWIYYADRLNQLPLGVIGIAIATVLLPSLSKEIKNNRLNKSQLLFNNSMKMASILVIPCAVGMMAVSYPIIQIFFERGLFKASDTYATAQILQILCVGLPALVYTKLYSNVFYARKDTKTPMIIAGVSLLFNLFLTIILTKTFSYMGVVLAITVANWINFLMLYYISYVKNFMYMYKSILKDIVKTLILSIVMGVIVYFGSIGIMADIAVYGLILRILMLILLIVFGMGFYFISLFVFNVIDFQMIKRYIKKS